MRVVIGFAAGVSGTDSLVIGAGLHNYIGMGRDSSERAMIHK